MSKPNVQRQSYSYPQAKWTTKQEYFERSKPPHDVRAKGDIFNSHMPAMLCFFLKPNYQWSLGVHHELINSNRSWFPVPDVLVQENDTRTEAMIKGSFSALQRAQWINPHSSTSYTHHCSKFATTKKSLGGREQRGDSVPVKMSLIYSIKRQSLPICANNNLIFNDISYEQLLHRIHKKKQKTILKYYIRYIYWH